MEYCLLILGLFLLVVGCLWFLIDYIKYSCIHLFTNGFDVAKKITSNYDDINIVEATNSNVSRYVFKRKVLRFTSKMYSSDDVFSLSLASLLSGISLNDNWYFLHYGKLIPFIDCFPISSFVLAIISLFMYSKGDAKTGIVLGILLLIHEYFYLQIISQGIEIVRDKLKVKGLQDIHVVLNHFYKIHLLFFVSGLVFILRFIVIVL